MEEETTTTTTTRTTQKENVNIIANKSEQSQTNQINGQSRETIARKNVGMDLKSMRNNEIETRFNIVPFPTIIDGILNRDSWRDSLWGGGGLISDCCTRIRWDESTDISRIIWVLFQGSLDCLAPSPACPPLDWIHKLWWDGSNNGNRPPPGKKRPGGNN